MNRKLKMLDEEEGKREGPNLGELDSTRSKNAIFHSSNCAIRACPAALDTPSVRYQSGMGSLGIHRCGVLAGVEKMKHRGTMVCGGF